VSPPAAWVVRSALVLLTATVGAAACGRDRFDPYSTEVERQRQARTTAVNTVVARVFDGLTRYGTSRYDSCEAGQDNFEVHDPYRMRCGLALRAVAGLDATTATGAITDAQRHLGRASCSGSGSTDPDSFGFTVRSGRPAGLWGGAFTCHGIEWLFVVGRSSDSQFASQVGDSLAGPAGTTVQEQSLDPIKAFAEASRDGHAYVLVADTAGDYYVEPRDS
jgi:hypothetical protein